MDTTTQTKGLIDELGMQDLPDELKEKLVATWAEVLQNRITLEIMDSMSAEEREQFNSMAENASDEEVNNFLADHVPELDIIIQDEYERYKDELIEQNKQTKEAISKLNDSQQQSSENNDNPQESE